MVSIHAPAKGATRVHIVLDDEVAGFNPRAREGRDDSERTTLRNASRFQSTRPRRARRTPLRFSAGHGSVSIHAPAKGATTTYESAMR